MSDRNEYSELDYKDIVTEILDKKGLKYKITGTQLNGCCPFHNDDIPSFGINLKTGLYNCFTCEEHGNIVQFVSKQKGISIDEANKMLDYPSFQYDYKYTLQDYATEKNLNYSSLKDIYGLYTNEIGVVIPYYDENMRYLGARFRHSPTSEPRFTWEKGTKTTLYGLWTLDRAPSTYIIITEGESDCHCAWSSDIVTVGIPRC